MKNETKTEKLREALAILYPGKAAAVESEMKSVSVPVYFENGLVAVIGKRPIEKEFWYGYSNMGFGPDYETARENARAAVTESAIIGKNIAHYNRIIEDIDFGKIPVLVPLWYNENGKKSPARRISLRTVESCAEEYGTVKPGSVVEDHHGFPAYIPTESEQKEIRAAYVEARAKHEKRVRAWLKRYGTTKARAETFWLDR